RIFQPSSFKQSSQDGQLLRPNGYEPMNVSVAGVMYEDRSRTVLCCSIREKVWLRREPDNVHDKNAIKVINRHGHQLGYIGRHLATRLAPYMDAGEDPIQAVITELATDVSGSVMGVKVGFYVPAGLSTEIRSHTHQLDYYCETGSTGATYILLDCDETTLNQVTRKLAEAGYAWARFGISYRSAVDGQHYPWHVVLEDNITQKSIEQFFQVHFGVPPQREQTEQVLDEWIGTFDVENMSLKQENAYLRDKIGTLQEKFRHAQKKIAETQQDLNLDKRKMSSARKDEVLKVIQILLPNVMFLGDSMDVITLELENYQKVLQALYAISADPTYIKAERVEAADGWKELHFSTGQKDDGRLYFKHDKNQNRWLVLVSFKGSQKKDIQYLQKN
ncbi:MAG: HIRAN domain-containing protein, partial [Bacteroidales bacterium]|nr:HIRAN domain-containing protein [Bacteroidales bacterium]